MERNVSVQTWHDYEHVWQMVEDKELDEFGSVICMRAVFWDDAWFILPKKKSYAKILFLILSLAD